MLVCKNCLLNDNIPSVKINCNGLCNYCESPRREHTQNLRQDEELLMLLDKHKDKKHQVIMAYSGGKDSTYTLKMIKERYNASILAITFNNGFISESSLKNINTVTDFLEVDSLIIKYPVDKLIKAFRLADSDRIFPETTLMRASSICNLCIMLVKNMVYYEAIVRDIPIICFGWTPGQVEASKPILKLNYRMVSKVFENTKNAIVGKLGQEYSRYFLDYEFMKANEDRIPYLYYPFVKNKYDENEIINEIKKIGWVFPENTDGNSSNCLLNSYANQSHINSFGYHPYAFEISNMIREGYITKAEGAHKLSNVKDDSSFKFVKKKFEAGSEKYAGNI